MILCDIFGKSIENVRLPFLGLLGDLGLEEVGLPFFRGELDRLFPLLLGEVGLSLPFLLGEVGLCFPFLLGEVGL